MSSVKKLAEAVEKGLLEALPTLRKTLVRKLPLAVAAVLEAQTANTVEIANKLPLESERSDRREQWLRRLLSNRLLRSTEILAPFACSALLSAVANGQVIELSMDQTDLGDRFAILMVSVRTGDRALPLCWHVEAGPANIGFDGQQPLLEQVKAWLPEGAAVMLSADRFYPSTRLLTWLQAQGWSYRVRLKGNLLADVGVGEVTTTGALSKGYQERYETEVMLFDSGVLTAIGILHEAGHPEPWIIAMDGIPNRAKVLDYASRWTIEPMFSDFKSRGFGLEQTHLEDPDRLHRLILIMSLAMYWCVSAGKQDAFDNPTPSEKKPRRKRIRTIGRYAKPVALCCHGSSAVYGYC